MKKAFTLIEIIFTIVIMAGIFMVIPKLIMIANKNERFAMKQDAYFNAITLTKQASTLPWDENNTNALSALKTANNTIDCNSTTHIRPGSFLSSNGRTCDDSLSASTIGSEEGSDYLLFDDIDDFNGSEVLTTQEGNNRYKIDTQVTYLDGSTISTLAKEMTIDMSTMAAIAGSTNIKKLTTTIKYNGKKALYRGKVIARFPYYSANIGQFTLAKREW